jgi:hypothetical protein
VRDVRASNSKIGSCPLLSLFFLSFLELGFFNSDQVGASTHSTERQQRSAFLGHCAGRHQSGGATGGEERKKNGLSLYFLEVVCRAGKRSQEIAREENTRLSVGERGCGVEGDACASLLHLLLTLRRLAHACEKKEEEQDGVLR